MFDAGVFEYEVSTSNVTNTITATPAAGWGVKVYLNDELHTNGTAATWNDGVNEVRVVMTELGVALVPAIEYVITVTKAE